MSLNCVSGPQADVNLQAVLICGWQDTPFMLELLTDLDRGVDKLPRGSEVVLLNVHDTEEISKHVKRLGRWSSLAVRHIKGNPLNCEDLKKVRTCCGHAPAPACEGAEESGEAHINHCKVQGLQEHDMA